MKTYFKKFYYKDLKIYDFIILPSKVSKTVFTRSIK